MMNTSLPGGHFELALVEMGRHYNTHLVNNDGEEDGFQP